MSNKQKQDRTNDSPSHAMPGFNRGLLDEVFLLLDDSNLGSQGFPDPIEKDMAAFASDAMRFAKRDCDSLKQLSRDQWLDFGGMIAYAVHMGFAMALYRYAQELSHVPELADWKTSRLAGGERGRQKNSERKQARVAEAARMLDNGAEVSEIARHFDVRDSTVYRWLNESKPSVLAKARNRAAT